MAGPSGPFLANPDLARLANATEQAAAATIVAALITAAGRPHSVDEALDLLRDVRFSLNPTPNIGSYQQWVKTKDTTRQHT
jgi:hypothetical protein